MNKIDRAWDLPRIEKGVRDKEVVRRIMSSIKGKDTQPEVLVRRFLFSKGLRFRKNDRRYPGVPDVVLPKYKSVIFVNGCFWHMHVGCHCFSMPKTRTEYWTEKLTRNRQRDQRNRELLESQGWKVFVIWECELRPKLRDCSLNTLFEDITGSRE